MYPDFEIDGQSMAALAQLYSSEDGLPFAETGLTGHQFLHLVKKDCIAEPEGKIIDVPPEPFAYHEGKVYLTPKGRAYVESIQRESSAAEKDELIRERQIAELKRIADLAEEKSEKAANSAREAEKSAQFSKRMTVITAVISALAFLSELLFGILQALS